MHFRVQHIALDVDDLAAAITFYCDGLGFTIAPRPVALGEGGVWLDIGDDRQLHLVESAAFAAPTTSQHLALGVDDCDATIAELRDRGLDVGDAFDVGAGRQAFLRDPAGNLLELNEPVGPTRGLSSSPKPGASHAGSTGGSLRTIVSTAASTVGTGRKQVRGIGMPRPNSHHGAQAAARNVAGTSREYFCTTSDWSTRSARTGASFRIVEQADEQIRRQAERRIRNHPVRHAREPQRTEVGRNDPDSGRHAGVGHTRSQPLDPHRVTLDGPHLGAGARQWNRERPRTGADVDDDLARCDAKTGDETVDQSVVNEEVLAQRTPTYVALAAPALPGHGRSPS